MSDSLRLLTPSDGADLADLLAANRAFLAPWQPIRPKTYFTAEGQRSDIESALERHARGESAPMGILDEAGRLVGRITLSGIIRGALLSGNIGYWVAESSNGRGYATNAVTAIVRLAFEDMGLHRVQAETLVHNEPSQRVLMKAGFTRYGLAPAYLRIAGAWQEHVMFQRLNDADE